MAAFAAVYKPPQAAGFRGGVSPLRGSAAFGNESRTTSLRSWKYTPIPAYGGTSPKGKHVTGFSGRFTPLQIQFLCHPGGGSLLSASPCANLSSSLYSAAKTSPSGGGAVGRRGAFPSRQRRDCMVFPRPQGGLPVFPRRSPVVKVLYKLAAEPPTTTLACEAGVNPWPLGPSLSPSSPSSWDWWGTPGWSRR